MSVLNLEFPQTENGYEALGIIVEGVNGKLSNSDLVLTVTKSCQYEGVNVYLHSIKPTAFKTGDMWAKYLVEAHSFVRFIANQAVGFPIANHALFTAYKIEAITLSGVPTQPGNYDIGYGRTGRVIESSTRALNNLLERFHHAYWFYYMTSSSVFLPIGKYVVPILLIICAAVIKGVGMWWESDNSRSGKALVVKKVGSNIPAKARGYFFAAAISAFSSWRKKTKDGAIEKPKSENGTFDGYLLIPSGTTSFSIYQRPIFIPIFTIVFCLAIATVFFAAVTRLEISTIVLMFF